MLPWSSIVLLQDVTKVKNGFTQNILAKFDKYGL